MALVTPGNLLPCGNLDGEMFPTPAQSTAELQQGEPREGFGAGIAGRCQ